MLHIGSIETFEQIFNNQVSNPSIYNDSQGYYACMRASAKYEWEGLLVRSTVQYVLLQYTTNCIKTDCYVIQLTSRKKNDDFQY